MSHPRQIVVRPVETCAKCGEVMPWRKMGGKYLRGNLAVWSARCVKCGARGQIRQTLGSIVTQSVKDGQV